MKQIEIESLYKIFTEKVETVALQDFNETIEKGEVVAVAGPSGSGKTTLLSCIGGVLRPTSGKILIDGVDITKLPDSDLTNYRRDTVGLIYQDFNLIDQFTVFENVSLPMLIANKSSSEVQKRVNILLDSLEIERYAKTFPLYISGGERQRVPLYISGGERQRVAIAVALANNPSIILADEPTGNLDLEAREKVLNLLISKGREFDKTIILATHDPFILERVERIIYLSKAQR
ncbi:MAG: ABC transporter ATP-binding protein [Candidatus Heimdallarchaeaceae archaeon]